MNNSQLFIGYGGGMEWIYLVKKKNDFFSNDV